MVEYSSCFIFAYLLGSLNPAALISIIKKKNLRELGTGNLGATNVGLALGKAYGFIVMVFDIAKQFTESDVDVAIGGGLDHFIQRPDSLDLTATLIEKGYDPAMGARPMRRVVQKTVENIVAKLVLSGAATPGSEITITADQAAAAIIQSLGGDAYGGTATT